MTHTSIISKHKYMLDIINATSYCIKLRYLKYKYTDKNYILKVDKFKVFKNISITYLFCGRVD